MNDRISKALVCANIIFENPGNKEAQKRLREIYGQCSSDEQRKLDLCGANPEVAPKLRELMSLKKKGSK